MAEQTQVIEPEAGDESHLRALADEMAETFHGFIRDVHTITSEGDGSRAVSLLLLEVSRVSLAGARLGAQVDFDPEGRYQPDVGPEADFEEMRMGLANLLGDLDTYSFVFDPYLPEVVESQLSDDLTAIASDLENGLRHHRSGDLKEALWWWQFSYVATWGNLAGAALNALLSVVSHDRLDSEHPDETDQVAAADEMLSVAGPGAG